MKSLLRCGDNPCSPTRQSSTPSVFISKMIVMLFFLLLQNDRDVCLDITDDFMLTISNFTGCTHPGTYLPSSEQT